MKLFHKLSIIIITCISLLVNPVYALRNPIMFGTGAEEENKYNRPGLPEYTAEVFKVLRQTGGNRKEKEDYYEN